jgi:hypothetical protein
LEIIDSILEKNHRVETSFYTMMGYGLDDRGGGFQFSAEVKNEWIYTSTPQYAFMAWCSVKAQ